MPKNWNRRFKHNREKIKTGDVYELAEVVRNLAIRENEKGLSTGEKQMYTRSKKILASELMYALEMEEDDAEDAPRLDHRRRARRPSGRRDRLIALDMSLVGIVPAGGSGERLGAQRPKAFVVLAGRAMLEWSARGARARLRPRGRGRARGLEAEVSADTVAGGPSRSESVRNAVEAAPEADVYVVHDAARPLLTEELVRRCVDALGEGVDGAIAAAPVTDTIKHTDGQGRVVSTLERSVAVGRPDAAGLPRRCAAPRAGRRRRHAGRRHRRRLAGRGGRGPRRRGGLPDRELQGDHRRWTCGWPRRCWPSDADRLPRAPAPRRVRRHPGALLHGRERRALPRRRGRARHRRAGRLRAHPPLHRRAGRVAARVVEAQRQATTSTSTTPSCARPA